MPRRKHLPDTRPNWRDPDMPVRFDKRSTGYEPYKQELASQIAMQSAKEPHYKKDPTYNLKRKK